MDMPRRLGAEFFGTFWLTFHMREHRARRRGEILLPLRVGESRAQGD
jgi:hypothetical protein